MRTTVDIPDLQYRLLKECAASRGVTVKSLVLTALETVLANPDTRVRRRLRKPILSGGKAGSLELDNYRIYDLIDFP